MARMSMQFIPNATSAGLIPMEDIPDDVRQDVEEAYDALKNANGRLRVVFDSEAEANAWCRQAASYASQREPVLKFRRSPTKGLPKNQVDFRVTADLPANGEAKSGKDDA